MSLYATAGMKLYIGAALAQKSVDFALGDFSGQSWTEIGGLESLGSLGDTSQAVAISILGEARDKVIKGTRSAGTMEVVAALDNADTGQLAAVAAEKTPHDYAFKLLFNDAPPEESATATITIASPGVVTWAAHGLAVDDKVKFSTTGALPTGLTAGTEYFVKTVASADTFTLTATKGGTVINTSSTQSGTHTVTTVPTDSERYFIAKVMSMSEQFDQANNVMKRNMSLAVNSNVVPVAATPAA